MAHGGRRPGAGRPKGSRNKVDGETLAAVRAAAQQYGPQALDRIVKLVGSNDDRIALAAANALLDRAYGKPQQHIEQNTTMSTISAEPMTEDDWEARHAGK